MLKKVQRSNELLARIFFKTDFATKKPMLYL